MSSQTSSRRGASGASLAAATYVFAVVMLGTTLPTPLYPMYQAHYGFGHLTTTVLFAVYALGVLGGLLLFGQASRRFGRRPVLVLGLVFSLVSTIIFIAAEPLWLLYLARVISGLSAGIFTATGTVTVLENSPATKRVLASALATAANIGGLGSGILLAGVVAEWLPNPLHTPYIIHIVLLVLAGIAMLVVRETVSPDPNAPTFQLPHIPAESQRVFWAGSIGAATGFAMCSIYSAVAPGFLSELLGVHDVALIGLGVALVFIASAVAQIALRGLADRTLILIGTIALTVGLLLLILSLLTRSLPAFLGSSAAAGAGQGLLFTAGMRALSARTLPEHRTQVTTSYFVVAYVALSVPSVVAGLATLQLSLTVTGVWSAIILIVITLIGLVNLRVFAARNAL